MSEIAGIVKVYYFFCGFRWNCTILGIGLDGLDLPFGEREACYLPRDHGGRGRVRGLRRFQLGNRDATGFQGRACGCPELVKSRGV